MGRVPDPCRGSHAYFRGHNPGAWRVAVSLKSSRGWKLKGILPGFENTKIQWWTMFSNQKKLEGNKCNWSLGPKYLTSFSSLTSTFTCPPAWPSPGQPLILGSSCPCSLLSLCLLPTSPLAHRPSSPLLSSRTGLTYIRATPPRRETGTGKSLSTTWALPAIKWLWALAKVGGVAESAVTTEGLSFHKSVMLLCFSNNRAPRHKRTIHRSHACLPKTAFCSKAGGKPLCRADWDMRYHR